MEQSISREHTASQRIDGCIAHNNAQVIFSGPQKPSGYVNCIRRMPQEPCVLTVDPNLRRFADRHFKIGFHAVLRQRSGFLNRRSPSEIELAIGSWAQVLGGEIERFQVATLTGIILERRIFAPGMKLGHADSLVSS